MRLEEEKMTNSEILRFIIEELGKSELTWNSDKELFELICAPLAYGNDIAQRRKEIKNAILALCGPKSLEKKVFDILADNIICGENEKEYRDELTAFLHDQAVAMHIEETYEKVGRLIQKIPCKSEGEKNYKNSFNNWKNGKTDRINLQEIKKRLEQNFNFAPSLWEMNSATIKQALREGVEQFVVQVLKKREKGKNIFDAIRKEFNLEDKITLEEEETLCDVYKMSEKEMMEYFAAHYPLVKHHSQAFIQKLVPILYQRGHYELLLHDVIEALDLHIQESKEIKKIKADIYGSPLVGEYIKAFDILSTIETDDDAEIVNMRTEAISNIRRHYLSDLHVAARDKSKIIQTLILYYEEIFRHNGTFHYYPAINLAYMYVIDAIITGDEYGFHVLEDKVNAIYRDSQKSIKMDKKSEEPLRRYYANITKLEFLLLRGVGNPVAELARYLELEEDGIPLVELTRTQRQMQFFIDTLSVLNALDHSVLIRLQSAIAVIDDFMEFKRDCK